MSNLNIAGFNPADLHHLFFSTLVTLAPGVREFVSEGELSVTGLLKWMWVDGDARPPHDLLVELRRDERPLFKALARMAGTKIHPMCFPLGQVFRPGERYVLVVTREDTRDPVEFWLCCSTSPPALSDEEREATE